MVKSFAIGTAGETIVISLLNKHGIECVKETDSTKKSDHDLLSKIGRKKFTIEVKYDVMAQKTGNLAIEHHNCKKDMPSGIAVTKATIWAHIVLDTDFPTVWMARTEKLKKFCEETKPFKEIYAGGDKNACLWLYQDHVILPAAFTRMDTLETVEFNKILKGML